MKDTEKIEITKQKIQSLINDNLTDIQDYLSEFLDEVEEDTHFLYNLQHCRELRNRYFDILNILEND